MRASVTRGPRALRREIRDNPCMSSAAPEPIHIDSALDPRVAAYGSVRERELAVREGLFLGETLVVLEAMLQTMHRRAQEGARAGDGCIQSVLASGRMLERTRATLSAAGCTAPLYTATDEVLAELTGIDLHRGVLAVGHRAPFEPVAPAEYAPRTPPRTVLVAEDITNIDNIGQLYRIAAAFAVDAVLLGPTCHDPLYRKSLRVSTGNALKVPSVRAQRWPEDLAAFCTRFDLALVSTAIQSSVPLRSVAPPDGVAIVVGHESEGVSEAVRAISRHIVRIPMARGVDSLNVAVSAAIALDHFSRGERA
jgi:tRNA G18 (ribose-2'-O)-methylase SpoU